MKYESAAIPVMVFLVMVAFLAGQGYGNREADATLQEVVRQRDAMSEALDQTVNSLNRSTDMIRKCDEVLKATR